MKFKEFIDIDSLKHAKIDEKPVKNYSGDYKELSIAKPPSNASKKTLQELKEMQSMFKDRTSEIEQSVKDHDSEVGFAVKKYLKENKLKFREEDIDRLADVGSSIVRYYKNKFERVRPYQLAEAMNMDFDNMPLDSDSMKSPAYPSGHSLQSRLIAEYYSEKYPEHRKGLIEAANVCGEGRIYAGWHYRSDHEASIKLAKQIYPNIKMLKSFNESIIDIPRRTYAKGVFDNADTDNPKLKQNVLDMINKQLDKFREYHPIKKYSLIGSILTKRYREDADLDINVLFDVPEQDREKVRKALASNLKDINGKLVPGTKHPVNYYVITDPELKAKNDAMADGVFDIEKNEFIRKPTPDSFDPEKYEADFQKKVREIDVVKGELVRDIIDYKELKGLSTNDVLNIQELIGGKLTEIEDAIKLLVDIGDETVKARQDSFNKDMSPGEIRDFGKKHKLPKNVIYKMLEKYHYLTFYKKLKKILEDGEVTDQEIDSIDEARRKTIAFTFGRFNPPTIGHEKLINKVASVRANTYKIFLSRSEDPKKNPLAPREKLSVMKQMFPRHARNIEINTTNMILDIATKLFNQGFTEIFMVVGSDRVREFETILNKYNNVRSRHGYYNFDNINVLSAGERDPDAEGATGMSASKMRDAASKGDLERFKRGLPRGVDAKNLMVKVRKGMNLAANYIYTRNVRPIASLEQFEQDQIRDLYIREMIFNIGDNVDYIKENVQGKVVRRSTNYIVLEDNRNNLHKAWIWDCLPDPADREVEVREHDLDVDYGFQAVSSIEEDLDRLPQDKDVAKKKGTQPKKYYKNLSKDVKDKRADHFKRQDTTKPGYKKAPGDDKAKTKPSIHTKKFKQMYGETRKEAYDIGHDYAQHAVSMTPGEPGYDPNYQGGQYIPSVDGTSGDHVIKSAAMPNMAPITAEDINSWSISNDTIDKYKQRYAEEWKDKLSEVVSKMLRNL